MPCIIQQLEELRLLMIIGAKNGWSYMPLSVPFASYTTSINAYILHILIVQSSSESRYVHDWTANILLNLWSKF